MRQKKLIDGKTGLTTGSDLESRKQSVKTIIEQSEYYKILSKFPRIVQLSGRHRSQAHQTMHHIKTTLGPSEALKRLALHRYVAVKNEFNLLLEEGIIQPSKRSLPLHMISGKKKMLGDHAENIGD